MTFRTISIVLLLASTAAADAPRVHFDTAYTIECRDISTNDFLETNPQQRLIEVTFQVSSLITRGDEADLIQYFYRIESPHGALQIVDFSPKTTLAAEHAGNISIETQNAIETSVGATVPIPNKLVPKSGSSAGITKSNSTKTKYDLLPPMDLLAASGTIHRGTGVYFKLKPSDRTTLEGAKEFVVIMRVSSSWRGDLMHVHCRAHGFDRSIVRQLDERAASGTGDFIVALHLQSDPSAKAIADEYVQAETTLRRAATEFRKRHSERNSSLVSVFGSLFGPSREPANWLSKIVYGPAHESHESCPEVLKDEVANYQSAKTSLLELGDSTR